jgi:hypothetical protein
MNVLCWDVVKIPFSSVAMIDSTVSAQYAVSGSKSRSNRVAIVSLPINIL